jgi:hypothetical protein
MPFRDPEERRRYDRERKRTIRAQARSEPVVLPSAARVRVLGDVENLLAEAVRLVLGDRRASGVQKARALGYLCSIGLRLIETRQLGERLEALEVAIASRELKATG